VLDPAALWPAIMINVSCKICQLGLRHGVIGSLLMISFYSFPLAVESLALRTEASTLT